jgi:hypothetical protein
MNGAKIASLREELASIYFADVRYWRQGTKASREATREYHRRRQDRVQEIRREFRHLLNLKVPFGPPATTFPASQRLRP